ncbi:MAG: hypothetical protein AVDCRST_MAG65-349, partial [uncultured Solirubrobacteraceae bacterium]
CRDAPSSSSTTTRCSAPRCEPCWRATASTWSAMPPTVAPGWRRRATCGPTWCCSTCGCPTPTASRSPRSWPAIPTARRWSSRRAPTTRAIPSWRASAAPSASSPSTISAARRCARCWP